MGQPHSTIAFEAEGDFVPTNPRSVPLSGRSPTVSDVNFQSPISFRLTAGPPQYGVSKDYDMSTPLLRDGTDFPCKKHQSLQEAEPLINWPAGSAQTIEFKGSATSGGGSCQASISEDGGASFKVIKSYVGGCPLKPAVFAVPEDARSGPVIFGW